MKRFLYSLIPYLTALSVVSGLIGVSINLIIPLILHSRYDVLSLLSCSVILIFNLYLADEKWNDPKWVLALREFVFDLFIYAVFLVAFICVSISDLYANLRYGKAENQDQSE